MKTPFCDVHFLMQIKGYLVKIRQNRPKRNIFDITGNKKEKNGNIAPLYQY